MTDVEESLRACIDRKRSFVLDAGAGAGKTYSLVQTLRYVCGNHGPRVEKSGQSVACITFTNNAKDQVMQRIRESPLVRVSTIHDFLWHVVCGHQKALKRALLTVNDRLDPKKSRRKQDSAKLEDALKTTAVSYSDTGSNFLEGRLFHDDLIDVAALAFHDNPLLSQIVAAQYPFILVDEYQDTSPQVIDILVGLIDRAAPLVVGLFGDKLQHIYDGGVGELSPEAMARFERVQKRDNRRCSVAVIGLLNRLRTDIEQFPAHDNVPGDVVYLHYDSRGAQTIEDATAFTRDRLGWRDTATENSKFLFLTHRVIAQHGGYPDLLAAYSKRGDFYRERMLKGEDPRISFFLERVEPLAEAWKLKDAGTALTLLRKGGFELASTAHKKAVADALDEFIRLRDTGDVRLVLVHLQANNLLELPDDLTDRLAGKTPPTPKGDVEAVEREARDSQFYTDLFQLPYLQVVSFAAFFSEHTPFSTEHGVKGAEFDTVYVVLDDQGAAWKNYSFDKYLTGEDAKSNPKRFGRSCNLFYVCCSRAKKHLAVVDLGLRSPQKSARVEQLFGKDKCHYL